MERLTRLSLKGFKSIREMDLALGDLNVLIGANGAGKSNFISFFKMLSWMISSVGNLQQHIAKVGGAAGLLFEGPAKTSQLEAHLTFEKDAGTNEYAMSLFHAAPDRLVFADEKTRFSRGSYSTKADWVSLGSSHLETQLIEAAEDNSTAKVTLHILKSCKVYQFHNTSDTARIRQRWSITDNYSLKEDAANLAPFLERLRRDHAPAYRRIVETIRLVVPFFDDFELIPESGTLMLQWREADSDVVFGPHQASDGSLRVMALVALLLQPEEHLPSVLILDEPELGLHPSAIGLVAGLIRSVSNNTQVIVATQSANFVDYFEPEELVVVNRPGRASEFDRPDPKRLEDWLEDYSLAELWEKNVLGGRPVA